MNKKPLDEILRVSRRVATTSNESVKGWPVRFAKGGERFPRSFIRVGLARLQYDSPVRRFERCTTFLQRAWNRFRNRAFSLRPLGFAIKIRVLARIERSSSISNFRGRNWRPISKEGTGRLPKGASQNPPSEHLPKRKRCMEALVNMFTKAERRVPTCGGKVREQKSPTFPEISAFKTVKTR
jgi:hypothetical protein